MKYIKWLAGGLGWAFGGPIGGVFGFALGAMFDNTSFENNDTTTLNQSARKRQTTGQDFIKCLLVLSAAVMKADGKVLKSELDYLKAFFIQQFGADKAPDLLLVFKEILNQDIPLKEVCEQIRVNMDPASRLQLLHVLFGIAKADENVDDSEIETIRIIAGYMQIKASDFESIKAMFWQDDTAPYRILEIEKSATDEEVKKAYRKMAVKHHPDKVAHLGEEMKRSANEKFLHVQEAYERIKKVRGMN